ncbi:MAG TPA: DUF4403 family protein [Thermoanaerobaculia bacterium]|jgi:hypothetical protein|nr:DUF4403 family protein [Thermoanaerobaculia bacterium]
MLIPLLLLAATLPTAPPPPAELSTIVIPIRTSLAPLMPQLEAQVPKRLENLDAYELDPQKQFGMKYRVVRDPIALNVIGSGIHAMTTVHYSLEGCRRTQKPFTQEIVMWPCISCGFGEPMRDAWISLTAHLDWDANWRLRSTTRAQPVDFSSNRCEVTFANIDITDWKIAPIVNDQLRQAAKTIDANTPKLTNIRPIAEQVWSSLQAPVLLAPRTWLVMDPADVALGPIAGSGLTLTSVLTLRARARVVIGERPPVTPRPLPALHVTQETKGGIRVPFDVEVPYDEATRLLMENYANRTYEGVAVRSIRLGAGPAEGRVLITIDVSYHASFVRHYSGLVYLEATPVFDPATRTVTLQNLDYSLDPQRKNPFLRIADRVAHDNLRTTLANAARWSVAPQIDVLRGEIARAVTRPLAPGVMMRGRVDAIEPGTVMLDANGIVLHVLATGSAEVEISAMR